MFLLKEKIKCKSLISIYWRSHFFQWPEFYCNFIKIRVFHFFHSADNSTSISKFSANPRLQTKRVTLLNVEKINPEGN